MSHEQTSDNRDNSITTMEETLDSGRCLRAFSMDRRELIQLLELGRVNRGLELSLFMRGVLDTEGSVIVVMDGPIQEPPDPPIPATGGSTVNLQSLGLGEVTAYDTSTSDLDRLKLKYLSFVKLVDLGEGVAAEQRLVAQLVDVSGMVAGAEQRIVVMLEDVAVAGAEQSLTALVEDVRVRAKGTQAGKRFASPRSHTRADGPTPRSKVG